VTQLFRPKPPLRFLEHIDIAPQQRQTARISPISSLLSKLESYKEEKFPEHEPTEAEKIRLAQLAKKQESRLKKLEKFDQELRDWDPLNDQLIKGSPYNTVFIGRLSYAVDEIQLQAKFAQFGKIERIRIVRDKLTNKSKGYAFIVFEKEASARDATREMNNVDIEGRKIITDYERGRSTRSWKPRRLGGGIGGRVDLVKKKQKERQLLVVQEAKGLRGGRGGGRGGRGGTRGARGARDGGRDFGRDGGSRGGRFDSGSRGGGGGRNFDERRSYRSEGSTRGGARDTYVPRARPERDVREESDRAIEYSSRSKRETTERDRLQSERDLERERNREKRVQRAKDDIAY
jgi:U1 small nuclear ribonucleoprotein